MKLFLLAVIGIFVVAIVDSVINKKKGEKENEN